MTAVADRADRASGGPAGILSGLAGVFPCAIAVLAAVFVLPQSPDSFEGPRRLVWGAFAVALAVTGFFRGGGGTVASRPGTAAGTALLAWMVVRSFAAGFFWRAAAPLVAWTTPLLLFLLASRFAWTPSSRRAFVRTVAVLGLAEAALMLLQRFGLDPVFGETTRSISYAPGRMIGTVGYQNQAAEFLGVAVCCVPAAWKDRRVRFAAVAFLAAALVLSANRGALFALAAVGAVRSVSAVRRLFRRGKPARSRLSRGVLVPVLLAVAAAVAVWAAAPELRSRIGELRDPSRSLAVRSRAWTVRVAASLWRDRPVFGWGAGGYAWEYTDRLGALLPERREHAQLSALVWAREAHCDPVQFGAEFGFVGVALALFFLASVVRTVRKTAGAGPAAAAIAFLSACSLFSFSWQTSLAAPAAGLLLGMAVGGGRGKGEDEEGLPVRRCRRAGPVPAVLSACAALLSACAVALAAFVPAAEMSVSVDLEESCWDAADGDPSWFLRGRWLAECAPLALRDGRPLLAAEMCALASDAWMSPDLLLTSARSLEAAGHGGEAVDVWSRLARCGLRHGEALRGLSLCLERGKRLGEAADAEAERFRLWPSSFSDAELFRLCALSLMSDNAARAETLSRKFLRRCGRHGETDRRWTPAWENLRGGALLALGRREEARACFESALRRDPALQSARRNLDSMK